MHITQETSLVNILLLVNESVSYEFCLICIWLYGSLHTSHDQVMLQRPETVHSWICVKDQYTGRSCGVMVSMLAFRKGESCSNLGRTFGIVLSFVFQN